MRIPGPVGPAWNLRLFRRVSLASFLLPLVATLALAGAGRLPQAGAAAISALTFACNWQFVRSYTLALERWIRRPGYQPNAGLPDDPPSNTAGP